MFCNDDWKSAKFGRATAWLTALAIGLAAPEALAVAFNWTGGVDDNWADAGNWDQPSFPNAVDAQVTINAGASVDLNASVDIESLSLGAGNTLNFLNSRDITANTGPISNDGTINMNSLGSLTDLSFVGAQTLSGSGQLLLSDNTGNRIFTNNTVLTQAAPHTIRGAGQLLANTGGLINQGSILAEGANVLVIDPNALGFVNQATLQASGSGGLQFNAGTFTNTGQTIQVDAGSKLNVLSGATIVNGTLQTTGSGFVQVNSGSTFDDIRLDGQASHANAQDTTILNGLINDGTWSLNSLGSLTEMTFSGAQTLSGSGEVVMSDNTGNRVLTSNTVLTQAAGHTIRGAGQLLGNSGGLINQGSILAEGANVLVIDPNGLGFVNQATLQASGSGGLQFNAGTFTNTGQTIQVDAGSKLNVLAGATIVNGTLRTSGTGFVQVNSGSTFDDIRLDGQASHANGQDTTILNGLLNDGTWSLNSLGSLTEITFSGAQTLSGSGEVVMSDNSGNRILTNSAVLTHAVGHTISGAGQLLGNTGGMINQGAIFAEGANALVIDPDALGFVNMGTLRAIGSGGLEFNAGDYINTGQAIEVENGSTLLVKSGTTIFGGTLQTTGSGEIFVQPGSNFDDIRLDGLVTHQNGMDTVVTNGLINDGTWSMNSLGSLTDLTFSGSQTLSGSGVAVLGDSAGNRILGGAGGTTVITHAAGHTIQGAGQLLANTAGMINRGSIIANGVNAITIDPNGLGFVNEGTMRATGSGGFLFNAGTFTNTGNLIEIEDGSKLKVSSGTVITGGTIQTSGTGFVEVFSGSVFDNIRLLGQASHANARDTTITNGLVNDGTWALNSLGSLTDMTFSGSQTLSGSGAVVMSDNIGNRIVTNNTILTHAAGHTIRGAGKILANTGGMINQGTILADCVNALAIDPNGLGFVNLGTMRASGSGGFLFNAGTFTNAGNLIEIEDGSRLKVSSGTVITGGTIQTSGTGFVEVISGSVFDNIRLLGQASHANARDTTITNGLVNDGTWALNSLGSLTDMTFSGAQTLSGGGSVVMSDNLGNRILASGGVLTQAAGHTIRGAGRLLHNAGGMINQGLILADGINALQIDPNALGFVNQGIVRASGTGGVTLVQSGTQIDNRGIMLIDAASLVQVTGSGVYYQTAGQTLLNATTSLLIANIGLDIQGGRIGGIGTIRANSGNGTLSNAGGTLAAGLSAGILTIDGDYEQLAGGSTEVELFGYTLGTEYDFIDVTGEAFLAGTLDVLLGAVFATTIMIGDEFEILRTGFGIDGPYDILSVNFAGFGFDQEIRGNSLWLVVNALGQVGQVPEPAPLALLLFALGALTLRRRFSHLTG